MRVRTYPEGKPRHASLIILFLAIIVLIAVMAFGLLDYTSTQRTAARSAHQLTLLRSAAQAGIAKALNRIESDYIDPNQDCTHLGQSWVTGFAATTIGGTWPKPSDPGMADNPAIVDDPGRSRRLVRESLIRPDSAWSVNPADYSGNAADLWRDQPGLGSPAVVTGEQVHAYDYGYTVSEGTARWFPIIYLDRDMVTPVAQDKAAYVLRVAVSVIDQSGLVLANKARYSHFTTGGSPMHPRAAYASATTALDGSNAILAGLLNSQTLEPAPQAASARPCRLTDPRFGPIADAAVDPVGATQHHYNLWRPIPADHWYLGYGLLRYGFGLDDTISGNYFDNEILVNTTPADSRGDHDKTTSVFYRRGLRRLPNVYRFAGFRAINFSYPQWSMRFFDHYPFEMSPWAPSDNTSLLPSQPARRDETRHGTRGGGSGVFFQRNPPVTRSNYPANYGSDNVGWTFASNAGFVSYWNSMIPPSATMPIYIEMIRNRHPTHLASMQMSGANIVVNGAGEIRGLGAAMMWNGLDMINWAGIGQTLRIHGRNFGTDEMRPQNRADATLQCFTPYGTPIGFFDLSRDRRQLTPQSGYVQASVPPTTVRVLPTERISDVPGSPAVLAKNQWEMRTQWAVNINTAPPQVLQALMRLVVADMPSQSAPAGSVSLESPIPSGQTFGEYDVQISKMVTNLLRRREQAVYLPGNMSPMMNDIWSFWMNSPTSVGFTGDHLRVRALRGLRSLIHGGPSGSGPVCEFKVNDVRFHTYPPNNTPSSTTGRIVLHGMHFDRFHAIDETDNQQPDTEYRLWIGTGPAVYSESIQDLRMMPAVTATASRAMDGQPRRIHAPFRVRFLQGASGVNASVIVDQAANTTQVLLRLDESNGYADYSDFEEVLRWPSDQIIAYIDYTTSRRRDYPDVPWPTLDQKHRAWHDHGPGLSLVAGKSRHYRIKVRSQLYDVDRPDQSREHGHDTVYMIDPDRSGNLSGNRLFDAVRMYSDRENEPVVVVGDATTSR